jgi:hypothetical protein
MLHGLFDVRLDARLGYGRQYRRFVDHKFFRENGVCFPNLLKKLRGTMPFKPTMSRVKEALNARVFIYNQPTEIDASDGSFLHEENLAMFQNFSYTAPEYQKSPDKGVKGKGVKGVNDVVKKTKCWMTDNKTTSSESTTMDSHSFSIRDHSIRDHSIRDQSVRDSYSFSIREMREVYSTP